MAKRQTAVKASSKKGIRGGEDIGDQARDAVGRDTEEASSVSGKLVAKSPTARKVVTVSITDLGDHLAATFDIPKSHAKIYLNEVVALIGRHLKKGSKIRLSGLGTLQVKKRAARKARNPVTGEEMKVKAGKRVVFAASSDLKTKL